MEEEIQTTNINAKWTENIYENIKKIEEYERLAREGCSSLYEYINFANLEKKEIIIKELQFKNLRFIVTEFNLLISDLAPIIEEKKLKQYRNILEKIENNLAEEKLFIKRIYNSSHQIKNIILTPFFFTTIKFLTDLKIKIFIDIKEILYVRSKAPW